MSGFYGIPGLEAVTTIGNSTSQPVSFNNAVDLNGTTTVNAAVDFKVDSGFRTATFLNFGDGLETRIGFDGSYLVLDGRTGGSGIPIFVGDGATGADIIAGSFSTSTGTCSIAHNSALNELEVFAGGVKVMGATSTLLTAYVATSGFGGGGAANSVTTTVNFGAGFTDKAQTVVTGQAWVASTTEIVATIKTPSSVDPDEMYLIDPKVVISNIVAGTGFTVTVYSAPEARGSYDVMCVGV